MEADDDIRFKKLDMLHDMTLWNVNTMEVLDGLKRYNPNQPRVPAGNSDGGQWSGSGGGGGGSGFGRNRSASGTDKVRRKEPKLVNTISEANQRNIETEDEKENYIRREIEQEWEAEYNTETQKIIDRGIRSEKLQNELDNIQNYKLRRVTPIKDAFDNIPPKVNIFIGGGGDENYNHNVLESDSLNHNTYGNNFYANWTQTQDITDLIQKMPEGTEINLIGHSYGGDTAAKVSGNLKNKINKLITVDPVSRSEPDFKKVSDSVSLWINVNAVGAGDTPFSGVLNGNLMAGFGGAWNKSPKRYAHRQYTIDAVHADFDKMMSDKTKDGMSIQSILNKEADLKSFKQTYDK